MSCGVRRSTRRQHALRNSTVVSPSAMPGLWWLPAVGRRCRLRNRSGPDNVTFMGWRVRNACFLAVLMLVPPAFAQSIIEFNRDIRPILSERCFSCHGPDAAHRQAGLRVDLQDGAKAVEDEILRRVASSDPLERMPPPSSGKAQLSLSE